MEYTPIDQAIAADGLRLVIVRGTPSPWSQATKAMMEYKQLDFLVAPQEPGGENAELVAWAGINSAPIVAWNDEPPINRWDDIVHLLERLAPQRPLLPQNVADRVQAYGLMQELCGELGLGWNRRLSLFRPAMQSGQAPEAIANMARKYRYNEADVALADQRQVETLQLLAEHLRAQREQGRAYFIGDHLSAVDFYWVAFCNLIDLLPPEQMDLDAGFRSMMEVVPPEIAAALDPILVEHRDRVMKAHFKIPMEI